MGSREATVDMGMSEWFADGLNEYLKAFSEGLGDFVTGDVQQITGHPAHSFETFARDFAQAFSGAPAGAPAS